MLYMTLLFACSAPVEAPAELGELSLYLYQNFNGDGEDGPEALVAGVEGLEDWLLSVDLTGDVDDRAVTPPILTEDDFGGVVGPSGADTALQVPVIVAGLVEHGMDDQMTMILEPNQVCIASDSTVYHQQTFDTDSACFADGSCERMETSHEVKIESLADVWLDIRQDYVWVEMEDGREAILARHWMPNQHQAVGGGSTWDQRYSLMAWIPQADGGGTMRFYSMWSSVTMTGMTDDLYATIVKNGLDEHYENTEAFINGEECDNDRGYAYDRE